QSEPAEAEFGAGPPPPASDPVGPGARWGSVVGVGVAAPGPLDHVRGVLGQVTGHPEWAGFPLRDALARRLGMPVVLDKDTNAAALGLALRGKESLAYVHLGTGLGAGLVLDGRIHRGRRNGAGEFGHQVIELDGPPCRCGRNGCLEALCGDAVRRGRPDEAARVLGVGAANLVSLLDVDRVLLGGRTVLADPDVYVDGVAAQLRAAAGASGGAAHRPGP
ncbi:ROK family protein, partial [Streptomyces nanshensis]